MMMSQCHLGSHHDIIMELQILMISGMLRFSTSRTQPKFLIKTCQTVHYMGDVLNILTSKPATIPFVPLSSKYPCLAWLA